LLEISVHDFDIKLSKIVQPVHLFSNNLFFFGHRQLPKIILINRDILTFKMWKIKVASLLGPPCSSDEVHEAKLWPRGQIFVASALKA